MSEKKQEKKIRIPLLYIMAIGFFVISASCVIFFLCKRNQNNTFEDDNNIAGTIIDMRNSVQRRRIRKRGLRELLKKGDRVYLGDTIRTAANSGVEIKIDNRKNPIKVGANMMIRIGIERDEKGEPVFTVIPEDGDISYDGDDTNFKNKEGDTIVINRYPKTESPLPPPKSIEEILNNIPPVENELTFTVTFDPNEGSGTPPPPQTVDADSDINVPNEYGLSKSGYYFGGWNTNTGDYYRAGDPCKVTANITLYARWLPEGDSRNAPNGDADPGIPVPKFTVRFDPNGGIGTPPPRTEVTRSEINVPNERGLSQRGHNFGGWKTRRDGTGTLYPAGSSYFVTADITLYAHWIPVIYKITYLDAGGGAFSGTHGTYPPKEHTYGKPTPLVSPVTVETGHEFGGWNTSTGKNALTSLAATDYTGDITLYPNWIPVKYTIRYLDAGGGAFSGTHGIDPPKEHTYGTETLLVSPVTVRTRYKFGGWNTERDGTVETDLKSLGARDYAGDITLYARLVRVKPEMVLIKAGRFTMGQADISDATPHEVTLTQDFYMCKYPVTQGEYKVVTGTNPSSNRGVGDNYPVYSVSWYDALVFCNELSMADDLSPAYRISGSTNPRDWGTVPTSNDETWNAVTIDEDSTGYRVPTEAQWEYACRAGTPTAYNTGDTITSSQANYNFFRTTEVGNYAPKWDLYDMHGNVWEWCWDRYGYYSSGAQTDPAGADSGTNRVIRGGSWGTPALSLRSADRSYCGPGDRWAFNGFRLVYPP